MFTGYQLNGQIKKLAKEVEESFPAVTSTGQFEPEQAVEIIKQAASRPDADSNPSLAKVKELLERAAGRLERN